MQGKRSVHAPYLLERTFVHKRPTGGFYGGADLFQCPTTAMVALLCSNGDCTLDSLSVACSICSQRPKGVGKRMGSGDATVPKVDRHCLYILGLRVFFKPFKRT